MREFIGKVHKGFGLAAGNLAKVMPLIEVRMGLSAIVPGTLNLEIPQDYIVQAYATVTLAEYGMPETIKLQRCVIAGHKAIIMRPDTHETKPKWGHGKNHFELLGTIHFRQALGLVDDFQIAVQVEGDDAWWTAAAPG